jgi:hypothetical protein
MCKFTVNAATPIQLIQNLHGLGKIEVETVAAACREALSEEN